MGDVREARWHATLRDGQVALLDEEAEARGLTRSEMHLVLITKAIDDARSQRLLEQSEAKPSKTKAAAPPPVGLKAISDRIRDVTASANDELERLNALLKVELAKADPPDDGEPAAPPPKAHKVLSRSMAEHSAKKKARKPTKAERKAEGVVLSNFLSSFDIAPSSPAESFSDTLRPAAPTAAPNAPEAGDDDPFAVLLDNEASDNTKVDAWLSLSATEQVSHAKLDPRKNPFDA